MVNSGGQEDLCWRSDMGLLYYTSQPIVFPGTEKSISRLAAAVATAHVASSGWL